MELELSRKQQMLVKSARDFLERECSPQAVRVAEKCEEGFSRELWRQMVGLGWTRAVFPSSYGGLGFGNMDVVLLMKEMGRCAMPSPFLSSVILSGRAILYGGTEAQKEHYLRQIGAGQTLVAFALTEASGAPTAAGVKCTASRKGNSFLLNGTKCFVEFAEQSDCLLVVGRTRDGAAPEEGLTMFIVDRNNPGLRYVNQPTLARDRQARVILENVQVAEDNVVGPVDGAWAILERVLQEGMVALSGYMTGLGERSVELCVDYSKERVQFGRPIGTFQALQNYMATCYTEVTVGEHLTYYAAFLLDRGIPARAAVATAKAFVGYACKSATQVSCQIHGGMGSMEEATVTLYLRRGKQYQLTLGTSQFHEDVLAQEVLDNEPRRLDIEFGVAIR